MNELNLSARVILRVDLHTKRKLMLLAEKRRMSVSDLIRDALEPHLSPLTSSRAELALLLRKLPGGLARR
jgi:hypothetical protein